MPHRALFRWGYEIARLAQTALTDGTPERVFISTDYRKVRGSRCAASVRKPPGKTHGGTAKPAARWRAARRKVKAGSASAAHRLEERRERGHDRQQEKGAEDGPGIAPDSRVGVGDQRRRGHGHRAHLKQT